MTKRLSDIFFYLVLKICIGKRVSTSTNVALCAVRQMLGTAWRAQLTPTHTHTTDGLIAQETVKYHCTTYICAYMGNSVIQKEMAARAIHQVSIHHSTALRVCVLARGVLKSVRHSSCHIFLIDRTMCAYVNIELTGICGASPNARSLLLSHAVIAQRSEATSFSYDRYASKYNSFIYRYLLFYVGWNREPRLACRNSCSSENCEC